MKYIIAYLFIVALLSQSIKNLHMRLPDPPRANDLEDHFGSNPSSNLYGPVPPAVKAGQLMRRGANEGIPITPITNFNQEISPPDVVAGNLTNTAPDASKIMKPKLAGNIIFICFRA